MQIDYFATIAARFDTTHLSASDIDTIFVTYKAGKPRPLMTAPLNASSHAPFLAQDPALQRSRARPERQPFNTGLGPRRAEKLG